MRISDWSSDVCSSDLIPLNSIWEGSGNVMCLDVLRALQKHPDSIEAYFAELIPARGNDKALDAAINDLKTEFADTEALEHRARHVVEKMMVTLQDARSEEHTSELQSLMRISYAVFCLKKTKTISKHYTQQNITR